MSDQIVVVDVPVGVDAGGVTVAAASDKVLPNRVLPDGVLPDGVLLYGVACNGVLPNRFFSNVVSPTGVSPSAVMAARAEADACVPDGVMAPGGEPVLVRLRRLPVFLLTSGPLANHRGGVGGWVSPRKNPHFTTCNSL